MLKSHRRLSAEFARMLAVAAIWILGTGAFLGA